MRFIGQYCERLLFSFLVDATENWSTHTKRNDIVIIDEGAKSEDDSHVKDDDKLTKTDEPFSEIEGMTTTKRDEAFVKMTLIVSIPVTLLILVVMICVILSSKR